MTTTGYVRVLVRTRRVPVQEKRKFKRTEITFICNKTTIDSTGRLSKCLYYIYLAINKITMNIDKNKVENEIT